ncbi:gliding motility protein RemB [Zunongwangia sp.]|uniref:gliding motility protein RemB n=1 Tax=Zunongwangia sp. TaxID=1965325 RepID=UPI003AA80EE8
MKFIFLLFAFLLGVSAFAQERENYPQFSKCESVSATEQEKCFSQQLLNFIADNYSDNKPKFSSEESKNITAIFEVDTAGQFQTLYISANSANVKNEIERIFKLLPKIKPATYQGRAISMQFRLPIDLSIKSPEYSIAETRIIDLPKQEKVVKKSFTNPLIKASEEYDSIKSSTFTNPRYSSQLNIPLSHEYYSRFDEAMNRLGVNNHTATKPFLFSEVSKYYNLEQASKQLYKSKKSLLGRKLWNEHLLRFQNNDYWFTVDFGLGLQIGKDFKDDSQDYTYNNSRSLIFQGGLGKHLNFYTVVYENQGRFAGYYNEWANSLKPFGGDPAIIPGRGVAKEFSGDAYDYPVAEAYLSYSPSKYFNFQFGHGKNFIGDGYRSLFLSDVASPSPYFKINTTFWKMKYTNTWMSLRDVRPEVTENGSFRTKYMANHYLSLNVTKRLNIGLFESVIWQNDNDRGFDVNYLNPVIFYRAIEFSTGSKGGNAIIGLSGKYKVNDKLNVYSQLIIDEFSTSDIFGGTKSWKNKLGYQLGLKYYNAFNVPNLFLRLEYNQVRPYTYSHRLEVLNYGHNNQSMAHLWGANFREFIAIARYKKDRWYGSAKFIIGKRGFDFSDSENSVSYGGNIYRTYQDRPFDEGVKIGQGNTANSFFGRLEAGYIVNPETNLKFFGSFIYRDFKVDTNTALNSDQTTPWLSFGIRTDIFNWYYDY